MARQAPKSTQHKKKQSLHYSSILFVVSLLFLAICSFCSFWYSSLLFEAYRSVTMCHEESMCTKRHTWARRFQSAGSPMPHHQPSAKSHFRALMPAFFFPSKRVFRLKPALAPALMISSLG